MNEDGGLFRRRGRPEAASRVLPAFCRSGRKGRCTPVRPRRGALSAPPVLIVKAW